jgi:hypothetical protein
MSTTKPAYERAVCQALSVHPKKFIFSDRKTGVPCFEVKATKDGSMPIEQAASLMAVHCASRVSSRVPAIFAG